MIIGSGLLSAGGLIVLGLALIVTRNAHVRLYLLAQELLFGVDAADAHGRRVAVYSVVLGVALVGLGLAWIIKQLGS